MDQHNNDTVKGSKLYKLTIKYEDGKIEDSYHKTISKAHKHYLQSEMGKKIGYSYHTFTRYNREKDFYKAPFRLEDCSMF